MRGTPSHPFLSAFVVSSLAAILSACGGEVSESSRSETEVAGKFQPAMATGRISYCYDGDTCTAYLDGETQATKLRLAGIDAPEVGGGDDGTGQPLGKEARNYLNALVRGKPVKIAKIEADPYGRTIAEIYVNGELVNMKTLTRGYAEAYKWATWKIDKRAYRSAEARARANKKGIWSLSYYESPSDFRYSNKSE